MARIVKIAVLLIAIFFLCKMIFVPASDDKVEVAIKNIKFTAQKAETRSDREKGLGGRANLCEKCAMLFLFDKKSRRSFWMKDMNFDIDIIWIADGKITYIKKNAAHDSLEIFNPNVQADRVLEINAGDSEKYGFAVGDVVWIN